VFMARRHAPFLAGAAGFRNIEFADDSFGGSSPQPPADAVVLDLPFRGRWRVENSPARRVPSHGTYAFGTSHAIDFVAVNDAGRSAPRTWRSLVAAEPPEAFVGFGQPILAPLSGTVAAVLDGQPDHEGRRSQLTLVPYMLGQAGRIRAGVAAVAGNHVVIAAAANGPFVLLAHLRRGSIQVRVGQAVESGDPIGQCGNSGNSTEPHVHIQVTDSTDWNRARGLPLAFRRDGTVWVPAETEIVKT
jgi:hypothetical protein